MESGGFRWILVDSGELWWIPMEFAGCRWISMDSNEFRLILMQFCSEAAVMFPETRGAATRHKRSCTQWVVNRRRFSTAAADITHTARSRGYARRAGLAHQDPPSSHFPQFLIAVSTTTTRTRRTSTVGHKIRRIRSNNSDWLETTVEASTFE